MDDADYRSKIPGCIILTPSDNPDHFMQPVSRSRNTTGGRRLCPATTGDGSPLLFYKRFAKCVICEADPIVNTTYAKGTALEPTQWWTPAVFQKHEVSVTHAAAVKRVAEKDLLETALEQSQMAANGQQARKENENAKCEAEIAAQTLCVAISLATHSCLLCAAISPATRMPAVRGRTTSHTHACCAWPHHQPHACLQYVCAWAFKDH
jgi:hypothetical protein